jgi:hypothetical protein
MSDKINGPLPKVAKIAVEKFIGEVHHANLITHHAKSGRRPHPLGP